jgi:hypothetical protein
MNAIKLPTNIRPRKRGRVYDAMARELRALPVGMALPYTGSDEDRSNLYRRMLKRGLEIYTAKISDRNFAVWIADTK